MKGYLTSYLPEHQASFVQLRVCALLRRGG